MSLLFFSLYVDPQTLHLLTHVSVTVAASDWLSPYRRGRGPRHRQLVGPERVPRVLGQAHARQPSLTRGVPPWPSKPRRRKQPAPPLLSPPPPRCAPARARTSTKARSPKAMPPSRAHRDRQLSRDDQLRRRARHHHQAHPRGNPRAGGGARGRVRGFAGRVDRLSLGHAARRPAPSHGTQHLL